MYRFPIHLLNVAGHTVETAGETPHSTKEADRFLTAVDANKKGCTHKQEKSVGSNPKSVTHKTLKSVLCRLSSSRLGLA